MEKMIQEYSKEIWWQKNKTLRNKSLKTKYMYRHFWWAFRNGFFLYFNIRQYDPSEMMEQWFKAFLTLEEDTGILASTYMLIHSHPYYSRSDALFEPL